MNCRHLLLLLVFISKKQETVSHTVELKTRLCKENLTLKNCLLLTVVLLLTPGLPWWLSGKEFVDNAGDEGSIPGSGRFPGERNGNPLQYSCLENPTDRGAWQTTVHQVTKSQTQLSTHALIIIRIYIP